MAAGKRGFYYQRVGGGFQASDYARSPWDPRNQNGIAIGGLAAHLIEAVPSQTPMLVARSTLDIVGTVPMTLLTGTARLLRDGPRMQLVEVTILAGEKIVARTTALRLRLGKSPIAAEALPYPPPAEHASRDFTRAGKISEIIEGQAVLGDPDDLGRCAVWTRFKLDLFEDEPLTPLIRAAMLSDFGGVGHVLDHRQWSFANLDISLHMTRLPVGEWLLIDALMESAGNGIALGNSTLMDIHGPFARAHQSLFIAPRGA